MERMDILEKIKSTEKEVRKNIELAQHKRNEIITQAQKQAQKLEDKGDENIKKEREEALGDAKKEIELKRQRILKKAIIDAEALKKKVQIKKATEFFIKEFKEFIHV